VCCSQESRYASVPIGSQARRPCGKPMTEQLASTSPTREIPPLFVPLRREHLRSGLFPNYEESYRAEGSQRSAGAAAGVSGAMGQKWQGISVNGLARGWSGLPVSRSAGHTDRLCVIDGQPFGDQRCFLASTGEEPRPTTLFPMYVFHELMRRRYQSRGCGTDLLRPAFHFAGTSKIRRVCGAALTQYHRRDTPPSV
jgi:hypothetical protein